MSLALVAAAAMSAMGACVAKTQIEAGLLQKLRQKQTDKPAFSKDANDYAEAAKGLKAIHPFVTRFSLSKSTNKVVIEALVPKTGATLFFDTMAIPKDAQNGESAHLFINYILHPEVHALLTNKVFYANPNAASLKFVKKEVAEIETIFLDAAATKTMVAPDALPQAVRNVQTRTFTNFKAARG